jgi:hypothetical protein
MNFARGLDYAQKSLASLFAGFGEEKEERILIGVSVGIALLFLAIYLFLQIAYTWIFH